MMKENKEITRVTKELKPKEKLDQHINKHKGSKNTC
jgi:hypothetical protein